MTDSEIKVIDTPNMSSYGNYLVRVARIPINPENPKDEEYIRSMGLRAAKQHFENVLGKNIRVESLDALVSFQIGENYGDLKGTFSVRRRKKME